MRPRGRARAKPPSRKSRETLIQARRSPTTLSRPISVKAFITTVEVASSWSDTIATFSFAPRKSSSYPFTSRSRSKIGWRAMKTFGMFPLPNQVSCPYGLGRFITGKALISFFRALVMHSFEQRHDPHDAGSEHQRRQVVAHFHVLQAEQLQRDADDQHAARRHERRQRLRAVAEHVLEQAGGECDAALHHQHRAGGQSHAPAERRGESDRREAVEQGLRRERLIVARQAVLD